MSEKVLETSILKLKIKSLLRKQQSRSFVGKSLIGSAARLTMGWGGKILEHHYCPGLLKK